MRVTAGPRWYERRYPRLERRAALWVAYVMAFVMLVGVVGALVAGDFAQVGIPLVVLIAMIWCIWRLRISLRHR